MHQGVSPVQSRKCSKRWWNVHSCNHAWMCVYLTTVQVNLSPQSLVLCIGAKAHKPSALWSACQFWNLRPPEKPPLNATALAPSGFQKKNLKVNQRGFFVLLLYIYVYVYTFCVCIYIILNIQYICSYNFKLCNTILVIKCVLYSKRKCSTCSVSHYNMPLTGFGSTFTSTCPQNINHLMGIQSLSGCVGGALCSKSQNSSSVVEEN